MTRPEPIVVEITIDTSRWRAAREPKTYKDFAKSMAEVSRICNMGSDEIEKLRQRLETFRTGE